ncbi:MAG: sulfatase-like hydrolase/transferase [Xanthomonadales bacterium]|jgi:arylsulfatase A-like enzyme|nr:sulfatase-like hydrolase/transferase [Xanthomonadales bacterium]
MRSIYWPLGNSHLAAAALSLLLATPCFAAVSGTVLNANGQALEGCGVLLGSHGGTSTATGRFEIDTDGEGSVNRLRIDCAGYAPTFVSLGDDQADLGEIILKRPNFILLLSDDQGWVQTSTQMDPDDPSTRSDYFKTPNIDRFFASGMRFGRGYSPGTYCMPTRRSIQVSQSPLKHAFNGRPVEEWSSAYNSLASIPRVLKAADSEYRTAHFGKWDLRYDDPDPSMLGYDESDGPTGNGEGNVGAQVDGKLDKFTARPKEDPKNIFDLTRRGSAFMEEQVKEGRPFYLQLSHYALHLSVFYRQESYDEVSDWPVGEKHYIPSFAAMLKDMDDGFGQLFDKIMELGIEDHTYVIYMADNGGRPTLNLSDGQSRTRRNEPLSEGKHAIYEGGIRVPFGIAGPGIEAGSFTRTAVSGVDILPTIADLVASDVELRDVDGGSLRSLVYQQSDTVERPYPFLVFHDKSARPKSSDVNADSETALMQGDYKLIKTWKDGAPHTLELYNVRKDPGEANNLTEQMPELAAQLNGMLDAYVTETAGDVTIDHDDWPPKRKKS